MLTPGQTITSNNLQTQLIAAVLEPIISEKRIEYRSHLGLEIDFSVDRAYGLCAKINLSDFKRVISNLINNAIEASVNQIRISVGIQPCLDNKVEIYIQDNGKGIPPEILARLGNRGETHGKVGGSGLGIFHAKTTVESWGGILKLESKLNFGTTVRIQLSKEKVPNWFMPGLNVPINGKVAILDDDSSIHHVWKDRFAKLDNNKIELLHLSTPDQVRDSVSDKLISFFLMDYELLGFSENGLDLIEKLSLQNKSCLVTSRFEEESVLKRCQTLGVKLIPKSLAEFVPIEIY
ncbi:MAG: ATP-binding protein [Deltaproteobacteria bacterium]|nr:ATP-binding protein [Deltaproteobacteria bacterium]